MILKKIALIGAFILVLSQLFACTTFLSPLKDKELVLVSGVIQNADGSPYQGLVKIETPRENYGSSTNAEGKFSQFLLGFEGKGVFEQAVEIKFSAEATDGSHVNQSKRLLKNEETLAAMRFWNDILSPEPNAFLTEAPRFAWQKAPETPQDYKLEVIHPILGKIWSQDMGQNTSASIPAELLENQTLYNWSVIAQYADYEARSTSRSFHMGQWLTTYPIQSAQSGGQEWPQFYDGLYDFELKDAFELKQNQPIKVILDLGQSQEIGSVVLASSGFSANIKVFIGNSLQMTSNPLATESIKDYQAIVFPETAKGRYIELQIFGSSGFRAIKEIRVLAPIPSTTH
jgi:hypothetical protein